MEQPTGSPTSPAGVVACAGDLVASLAETLWAAKTSGELVEAVQELERLRARLAAVEASVVAEVHAREVPRRELGWGSTSEWFTHLAGTHRREGHRMVRQAAALVRERAATHEALASGAVSPDQAAVIVTAVERLPHEPGVRDRAEQVLLGECGRLSATELVRAARHVAAVADPDGTERDLERALDREDRAAHLRRFLAITEDGAGGVRLSGRGTLEDAATIKAALLPLTKPEPVVQQSESCADVRDPRDHGARLWDALVETSRHALTTDLAPEAHGARPRLTVTTSLDALRHRIDWATLGSPTHPCAGGTTDDGLELSPATVRRLACDAELIPACLGSQGEVLDVGRAHRLVTPALWRALVCRDRHCAFPGCTRPPVMGHAHHIVHWADGGQTKLGNLVLVCGHHHRTLHHTPGRSASTPTTAGPSSSHHRDPATHHSGSAADQDASDEMPLRAHHVTRGGGHGEQQRGRG